MKSKDQTLLEEAYTNLANNSCSKNLVSEETNTEDSDPNVKIDTFLNACFKEIDTLANDIVGKCNEQGFKTLHPDELTRSFKVLLKRSLDGYRPKTI